MYVRCTEASQVQMEELIITWLAFLKVFGSHGSKCATGQIPLWLIRMKCTLFLYINAKEPLDIMK